MQNNSVKIFNNDFGDEWKNALPSFTKYGENVPTRNASGSVINAIAKYLPTLIGGSADLEPSNNTYIKESVKFSAENRSGKKFSFWNS